MNTRTRSDAKGGTAATAGFRYQFLRTAEVTLDQHERDPSGTWIIRVESDDDDAVDYQVLPAPQGPAILTAQVKSSLPGSATTMTRPDALKILEHLTARHPGNVALDTNRHLNGAALALACSLEHHQPVTDLGDLKAGRASIRRDQRTIPNLQAALTSRVRRLRARDGVPASPEAASLVAAALIDLIFERATLPGRHTITASEVARLLKVHGADLATALGRSPTWIPLQPPISAGQSIVRQSVSSHLDAVLDPDVFDSGVPDKAAVTGAPGIGKSSAVAAWARSKGQRYTVSIWITAGSAAAILEQVRALLVAYDDLGETAATADELQHRFRTFMAALPFPWLLVFDGVTEPTEVDGWVPGGGFGHVVYTSVDTTWPTGLCPSLELQPIRGEEARELLLTALGTRLEALSPAKLATVDAMAAELGGWPLAIVTAGSWLRDCRGGISGIDQYLTELSDLDLASIHRWA